MPLSRGGSFGGLSRDRSRFPFPDDPDDPDPAMEYGSSSGTGMRGRFRISMAVGRGFLTVKTKWLITFQERTKSPSLTWRHLGLEHVHGDNVDEHDPTGRVENVSLVLDKGDCTDTLGLQLSAIGVGSPHLPTDILLEFFHVEEFDRFFRFQDTVGHLENVRRDGVLFRGDFDIDVALGDPLDQNVSGVVHFDLAALKEDNWTIPLQMIKD